MKIAVVSPYPPSKGTLNEYAYHLIESMRLKEEVEEIIILTDKIEEEYSVCLLYTSPSPRDRQKSRMPSSA